tara:strand:+ start:10976 stop:11104 length:129 start_codon:yes stop_codon:yes gene_type:complete
MEMFIQIIILGIAFWFMIESSEIVANQKGQSLYKNNKDGDDK